MNIQYASKITGVSKDMIRFYEKKGILKPQRSANNYRNYTNNDLNTIVLAKQYSMMGIHLDTIAALFQTQNLTQASQELSLTIEQLQEDILWSQARLATALEYQKLFSLLQTQKPYDISNHVTQYYYPIHAEDASLHSAFNRFGSVTKSVFRIKEERIPYAPYPQDIGLLSPKMHPDQALNHQVYPEHTFFRTIVPAPREVITYDFLKPIFDTIDSLHYHHYGDLFIYEIMRNKSSQEIDTYIVIEVMIEPEPSTTKD